MSEIIDPGVNTEDTPAAQAVALERLKYTISLLPGGSPFGPQTPDDPPDVRDPVVIDLADVHLAAHRQSLATRVAMLESLLTGFQALGLAPPVSFRQAFLAISEEVIALQSTLRPKES